MDTKREIEIKERSIEILTALSDLVVENLILKAILDTAQSLGRLPKDWKQEAESLRNSPGVAKIHSNFAPLIADIQQAVHRDRVVELIEAIPLSRLLQ